MCAGIKNPHSQCYRPWGLHPASSPRRLDSATPLPEVTLVYWSGRSSGLWITLLTAPSRDIKTSQWHLTAFVPIYSGGTTPDLHRVPSWLRT